jgi:ribosome-associated translation inhibitor RaiA
MDLVPDQVKSIEEQFRKVAKLLDGKSRNGVGEQEAHVRLSQERHLHHVEVTMNFHHHALVCADSNVDLSAAVHGAIQKLETQAIKVTKKWSDGKRVPRPAQSDAAD